MNCDNCGNEVFEGHYTILCHKPDCVNKVPRQPSTDDRENFEKAFPVLVSDSSDRPMLAWHVWQVARAELREVREHPVPAPRYKRATKLIRNARGLISLLQSIVLSGESFTPVVQRRIAVWMHRHSEFLEHANRKGERPEPAKENIK